MKHGRAPVKFVECRACRKLKIVELGYDGGSYHGDALKGLERAREPELHK